MQLSNSSLGIFKDCPRCFWLDKNKKLSRPRGIMSSLPNGIDKLLKEKLEKYRGLPLPCFLDYPMLSGFELYDGSDLAKMRHWKSNPLKMTDAKGNTLVGAFDDLLFHPEKNLFAVLDYKTKGSEPDQEYCEKYYQDQIDIYTRFLELGKKKVGAFGVLLYFWPVTGGELLEFKMRPFFIAPRTENAEKLFTSAIACLEGPIPEAASECEYCKLHKALNIGKY